MVNPPGVGAAASQAEEFSRRAASAMGPRSIGWHSADAGADMAAEERREAAEWILQDQRRESQELEPKWLRKRM